MVKKVNVNMPVCEMSCEAGNLVEFKTTQLIIRSNPKKTPDTINQ